MSRRLRVGVPAPLTKLTADSGHGKVWRRVLDELSRTTSLHPLDGRGRPPRRGRLRPLDVVLADGHAELPPAKVPIAVQVHEAGWFEPELRALLHPEFAAAMDARTRAAVARAAVTIVPSEAARRDLLRAYGPDPARVHAVHHGADPVFDPGAAGGAAIVARARGGSAAPYVLFAAVLHPRKNLACLRDAMVRLLADGRPHVLVVVGRPPADGSDAETLTRTALAELPGAPGRVVAVNEPSDGELAGLMADASAFSLPSLYEGFGLPVIEAMACGAPVVVSDRGALPEVVGDAGLVVAPEPGPLAGALARVLDDPAFGARLGRLAARRAREFTWERTAAGWLEALEQASRGPRGGLHSPR